MVVERVKASRSDDLNKGYGYTAAIQPSCLLLSYVVPVVPARSLVPPVRVLPLSFSVSQVVLVLT